MADQAHEVEQARRDHSPGIPAPRREGERETGDTFTATTEGSDVAGPEFGSPVIVPGEGGFLSGPSKSLAEEEEEATHAQPG